MGFYALLFLTASATAARHILSTNRVPKWKALNDINQGPAHTQPEQVHLSYGGDPSTMFVTWLTFDDNIFATVEYGTSPRALNLTANGTITLFIDGGSLQTQRYISRVTLTSLEPGTTYFYHAGSEYGWSPLFTFTALKPRDDGGFFYGDMGNENPRSLGRLQKDAQSGAFDVVLHVGDFAYDMYDYNGTTGDEFNRQLEPVAAYVPYMTVVGNHENAYNFSHFVNRYTMPGTPDNHFYSFDIDKVHFIAFSTEFYFYTEYGTDQIGNQYAWLVDDLKKANENRKDVPWIITMGHRPMYCSTNDSDDCTKLESVIRTYTSDVHNLSLEELFYTNGVDLEFWAHEHTYERMFPVYNRTARHQASQLCCLKIFNGTQSPYVDPPAPVHIVTGAAGCPEGVDPFIKDPPPWSAFRSNNYGFSTMQVFNESHIYVWQTAAGTGAIEDDFWVVKNKHGPYGKRDLKFLKYFGTRIPENFCDHNPSKCLNKKNKNGRGLL